jgi:hypothetical protein
MPVAGLAAASCWAVIAASGESSDGVGNTLKAFGLALLWPGVLILLAVTFLAWLAWKIDLD